MAKLYVINGKSGAGKDTFCKGVAAELAWLPNPAVIEKHASYAAKSALKAMGWMGLRTEEVRKMLVTLTDFGKQQFDTTKLYLDQVLPQHSGILFFHERDPKEIQRIKESYLDVRTILVIRDGMPETEEDIWGIEEYSYDYIVYNSGGMRELQEEVKRFIEKEGILTWFTAENVLKRKQWALPNKTEDYKYV